KDFLPDRVEKQPRAFPSVVPGRPTVYFVWPQAEPDATLIALLQQIVAGVTYLGSSRSPVRVRLCDSPPRPTLAPDDAGPEYLRVAGKGRLERLEWHHRNGMRPPAAAFQNYSRVWGRNGEARATSVFGDMIVFRLGASQRVEIGTALKLTDTMRAAVLSIAG